MASKLSSLFNQTSIDNTKNSFLPCKKVGNHNFMRAFVRRISPNIISGGSTNPPLAFMDPTPRLAQLILQLRQYKPPSFSDDEAEDDNEDVDDKGKVFSQVGLSETSVTIIPKPQSFKPKRAAVLVCLFEGDSGELRVILTKRSSKLSTHSGEVALPGGKMEDGDADDSATATREAKEEIGLDPALVTTVTVLQPFLSKHLLRVVPVIGILTNKEAFDPVANADEVETIFDAPLEMFLKDENRRCEEREWMGTKFLVHYFDFEEENKKFVIWGLTAAILIRAASVVYKKSPDFKEQNPRLRVPKVISSNTVLP